MIISDKQKFIFVHTRKAAGSSITVSLSRFIGHWDLQIGAIEDAFLRGIKPNFRSIFQAACMDPLRFFYSFRNLSVLYATINNLNKKFSAHSLGIESPHFKANEIREKFPDKWNRYFTFAVTRNPWEVAVSGYLYTVRRVERPPSFERFIRAIYYSHDEIDGIRIANAGIPNHEIFMERGVPIVDFVLQYNTLFKDFAQAYAAINLPGYPWLPRAKASNSETPWKEFYTKTSRNFVHEMNQPEISHFRYKFTGQGAN